jgi:hypothetical protein
VAVNGNPAFNQEVSEMTRHSIVRALAVGGALLALSACGGAATGGSVAGPTATATAKPAATAAQPTAAPTPKVLLDVSGTNVLTTEAFTAPGAWDLAWSLQPADYGTAGKSGQFSAFIYTAQGTPVDAVSGGQSDQPQTGVSHEHQTGTFYLKVNSIGAWHVVVTAK